MSPCEAKAHIITSHCYVRAGILDEPDGEVDVVGEIRRDPDLTEEHKKMLVKIYHSFRRENEEAEAQGSDDRAVALD